MLELIEWALYPKYCEHFDKQGFIPTDNTREDLIKEAEIVEREYLSNRSKNNRTNKHKSNNKRKKAKNTAANAIGTIFMKTVAVGNSILS